MLELSAVLTSGEAVLVWPQDIPLPTRISACTGHTVLTRGPCATSFWCDSYAHLPCRSDISPWYLTFLYAHTKISRASSSTLICNAVYFIGRWSSKPVHTGQTKIDFGCCLWNSHGQVSADSAIHINPRGCFSEADRTPPYPQGVFTRTLAQYSSSSYNVGTKWSPSLLSTTTGNSYRSLTVSGLFCTSEFPTPTLYCSEPDTVIPWQRQVRNTRCCYCHLFCEVGYCK